MKFYIVPFCAFLFVGFISDCEVSASLSLHPRQARQGLAVTCTVNGYQPYPGGDVTKYIRCIKVGSNWYYYVYQCPAGSGFVPATSLCTVGVTLATTAASTTADTTTMATTTTGAETTTPASAETTTVAGATTNAGTTTDTSATTDAGTTTDAGATTGDSATTDAGTSTNAGSTP